MHEKCVPAAFIVRATVVKCVEAFAEPRQGPCGNGVKNSLVRGETHRDLVTLHGWQTTVNYFDNLAKAAAKRFTDCPLGGIGRWPEKAEHGL